MRRTVTLAALALTLAVTGCSSRTPDEATPADASVAATAAGTASVDAKLAELGLAGQDVAAIIEGLDQTQKDKEIQLNGSVRQDELLLTVGDDESTQQSIPMPQDKTYVSVAPYVSKTHECFAHHLTGCQGEQVGKAFDVTVTDSEGTELFKEKLTSYENGFVGFWLPRDVNGTLAISGEQGKGSIPLSTADDAPTCITTLQLA
ncbi:CueP family metal-binding protein [Luteococcus sp. Sow4_B9]|uniref:CueP family metal-binding protein n=1 Tax=Luteococcus sp. Sow4_B9 TaxID=3438792 RepID=UPI003F9BA952